MAEGHRADVKLICMETLFSRPNNWMPKSDITWSPANNILGAFTEEITWLFYVHTSVLMDAFVFCMDYYLITKNI